MFRLWPKKPLPSIGDCPDCAWRHSAKIGVIGESQYGMDETRHVPTGDVLMCARCGCNYCVAGGQKWRWLEGQHVAPKRSESRDSTANDVPKVLPIEREFRMKTPEPQW
jgi:hypothetical protein